MRAVIVLASLAWLESIGLAVLCVIDPGEPDSLALRIGGVVAALLVSFAYGVTVASKVKS